MNTFALTVFFVAVASASAGHLGLWGHEVAAVALVAPVNPAAHIPSGSVSVGHNGVVIAGPAGSVHTDNGLSGHGAGVNVAGPAGDIRTKGGLARLSGPGIGHDGHGVGVAAVAPIAFAPVAVAPAFAAPIVAAPLAHGALVAGPVSHASVVGPSAHATIVGASAHTTLVAPSVAHGAVYGVAPAVASWGHDGVISHGLLAHGHHGW